MYGKEQLAGHGVRSRAGLPRQLQLANLAAEVVSGIAKAIPVGRGAVPLTGGQVLETRLVVDVVLVEQGTPQHREEAPDGPGAALQVEARHQVALLDQQLEAKRLAQLEQLLAALGALQPVELLRERRLRRQPLLLRDEGKPEVDREDDQRAAGGRIPR